MTSLSSQQRWNRAARRRSHHPRSTDRAGAPGTVAKVRPTFAAQAPRRLPHGTSGARRLFGSGHRTTGAQQTAALLSLGIRDVAAPCARSTAGRRHHGPTRMAPSRPSGVSAARDPSGCRIPEPQQARASGAGWRCLAGVIAFRHTDAAGGRGSTGGGISIADARRAGAPIRGGHAAAVLADKIGATAAATIVATLLASTARRAAARLTTPAPGGGTLAQNVQNFARLRDLFPPLHNPSAFACSSNHAS